MFHTLHTRHTRHKAHIAGDDISRFGRTDSSKQEVSLAVDALETKREIICIIPLAGIHPKYITVSLTNDILTISGKRSFLREDILTEENRKFLEECYWGEFSRSIALPQKVHPDSASAEIQDNILTIRIPKSDRKQTNTIPITILEKTF